MIGSLWDLILSFRSSVPGRRSIVCIDSKVTFLCGVVCFSARLTGWINSFRLSIGSVTVFVVVVVIIIFFDIAGRVRVIGVAVFVSGIILIVFSVCSRCFFNKRHWFFFISWFFYRGGTLVWVCRH